YAAARWIYRNRDRRGVRAFKYGMAPIVVALIVATGWILASVNNVPQRDWPFWLLTAGTAALVLRTRLHLLWMLGTGALVGALWLG
ncbi:MAG TPA: chromate transporter, partial [Noviherbaspirillum sp.]|nr:chromate transporter [Noviherbaspirillum sp.]